MILAVLICLVAFASSAEEAAIASYHQTTGLFCPRSQQTRYTLTGDYGREQVKIDNDKTYTLYNSEYAGGTRHSFWTCGDSATIEFLHDNGDVLFWSPRDHTIEYLENNDWNCGSSNENYRCDKVREGDFLWWGRYKVTFSGPIPQESQVESTEMWFSVLGTNDLLVNVLALVGLGSTLYFLFSTIGSKMKTYATIDDASEV